jgi:hypothetical protein
VFVDFLSRHIRPIFCKFFLVHVLTPISLFGHRISQ